MMNETQENKVEETSNENEFVVEIDENQESTKKEAQPEKEEQTIVRSEESDEHESYSEKVQKRIDQLTAKRKAAEDDMNNAIKYGKQVEEENQRLKKQLETYTNGYTNEFDTRVQSQEAQVKQLLKEAYDAQDVEKIAEANSALTQVNIEKERLRVLKQQREQEQAAQKDARQSSQKEEVKQPSIEDNPKIKAWIAKNPWYGKDDEIEKNLALMLADKKVSTMYDATDDRYYEEIDKEMAKLFPPDQSNSNVQTVAPVNGRASVKTGRKQRVVLTESERRTADRLGVPYEKYAQQKLKLQKGA
jgi:chemotaxis protein histidine kinase CheA